GPECQRIDRQLECFARRRATQGLVARMEPTGQREAPPDDRLREIRGSRQRTQRSRITLRSIRATTHRLDLPFGPPRWYGSCTQRQPPQSPDKTPKMASPRPDRIRKLLTDLVAFDTVSDRSNLPLIAHIESYLASLGVGFERIVDDTGQKAS